MAPHAHTMRTVSHVVVMAPGPALPIFSGIFLYAASRLAASMQNLPVLPSSTVNRDRNLFKLQGCPSNHYGNVQSGNKEWHKLCVSCHRGGVTVFLSLIPLYTWQLLLHWKLLEGRHYTSLIWHQFYSTVPCLTRGRRCSLTVLKQLNNVYK